MLFSPFLPMTTDLQQLLRTLNPRLNPEKYAFVTLPPGKSVDSARIVGSIREPEGVSVILDLDEVKREELTPLFVCSWITLTVQSDLQSVGLTAAVSGALSEVGISCNVVAGAFHDHLFVPCDRAQEALAVLGRLQRGAMDI